MAQISHVIDVHMCHYNKKRLRLYQQIWLSRNRREQNSVRMEEVVTMSKAPPMEFAKTDTKRRVSVRIDKLAYRTHAVENDKSMGKRYPPIGIKDEKLRPSSRARGGQINPSKKVEVPPMTPLAFSTTHRLPLLTDLSNGNSKKFFDEQDKLTKQVVMQHRQTMMKSQLNTISQYSSLQQNLKTI